MDDQASPSIDWSQFKPVAPEAPSSAVDWSQFKPATNGGNAAMAGDAGVPDFGTPDTPYTPGSQPDIGEGLSKVAGVGTSFLRGTAAGMAQLPLKATKYTDLALATGPMLADAVRSGVTGKQHSEATDWWMRNMVAPADASLQSLQDFTNESGNAAAAHGGQAVGNMGTNLAAMVLTGGESAAPELAAAGGGAIRQGADILGKALATSAKASAVPATTEGLETGEKVYDETGDAVAAIKAGAADAALTVGQNMLPISVEGGKALRAGVGAASSAVAGEARRQAQNTVMPGTLQTPFDWGDVGMNALFGAGMGVAFHGPHVDDPNVVAQKYNDLQRAADDGNAVAQKATTIVGDLSSVDGLSSHAITSAQLGASAGADVHDVPHEQLMQTSDRYRQIYNAATPDLSPEQAQSYAKEAYASEVSNNVAWDAYLSQKNLLQQNAGQARIASDIRTMLDTASKQVDPVEMNKLQRWAMAAPRAPLEVRNALYETLTNRAVPDHIEAQHGEDFHPDGALTDKALAKDASPDHVDVSYPDTPEVATALKTTNVVPYRVGKTLVVHGQPDDVQPIVEYLHATTGQLPHAGVHHAEETAVHAEDQDGQSQRDEGDQGGHAAGERAVAESGQPVEADRLHEGSPEQVDNTVTPRNKAVLDSLTKAGLEAKVNARGRIEIHPGSQHADQLMEAAAHDTNEEVTPAQAASGNYRKGKSILRSTHGDVSIHIETPDGVTRRGEGWSRPVRGAHYGYIPGTKGADGDPLDVFAMRGAHDDSRPVAVISQHDPKTGAFDELKVVMGARTKAEALQTYKRQYPGDLHAGLLPKGKANVVMMDRAKFKRFLDANAADVPPHPVSGMPMLHLRRDRLARNEDVDHVPQNQGAVGRHGQAVEGEDAQSAGGQLHARPAVPSEGPRKESPQARGIRKVASDAPVYQHGQGAKPVSVVGVHYSTTPGLTALDPRKAGTGSAGRERMRIGSSIGSGDPLSSLVHFYVREGKGLPEKERVVSGQHPYEAKLNNLYDVRHDPEGIIDSAYQHGYGMNKDAIMEAIHDAGYDGVLMKSQPGMPEGHIAAVFGDGKVPVKSVAEEPRMALGKEEPDTIESRLAKITGVKAGSDGEIVDRAAYDKAVDAYSKIPDTMGGKILSTDVARELSPDYLKDRTLSADTHEAASSFIKALYREKLAEPPGKNAVVVFTAGGTGAGKTSALIDSHGIQFADLVYDTNLNGSSSLKKIMQALDSGRNVQVMYVYRDPVDAMRHGALIRAERQAKKFGSGRTVPVSAHVETHVEALGSVRGLIKHFAGDDRFSVKTFDNSFGKGNVREVDIDSVKDLQYDVVNKDVIHTIEEAYQHGEISAQTYKGFLGRHPQERLQGGERAQGGSDQREAGPDRSGPEGPERESVHGLAEPQRDERRPDQVSQFSWEAVPSMSIPDHAWIHEATPEFKMAYTKAVNDAIGSKILDEFGIDHAGVTVGFGGWEGAVNPSVQEHFSKAQQHQLANAAATYGLLLKQDGVAYHTPEYSGKPSEENGVHVQVGRPLNAAETGVMYDRIVALAQERFGLSEGEAQGFAPIPNAEGVRFLNFNDGVPNKAFHKLVTDAASETLDMDTTAHTFKSVGDLITNDWSAEPHGKVYVQRLIEAGGWDSARRTLDRLRPEVARIDQDFRARAEAGDGGQAAADQIHSARAAEAVRHSDAHFKEISSHVQKVAGTLKQGDRMVVYRRLDDVPKNDPLRAWVNHMVGNVNAADIGGVYHNGRVYLFAENLKDRADAERVVMHETVGHGGIRAVFGDDLGKFLDSIHDTVKNTSLYREIESAYARAYPKASAAELRRVLADEYMAALAESPDERGVWAKFVGWVRQWARAHGMVSKWTENDLRQLLGKVAGDMRYGRVSIGGREAPQTLLDIEIPTSTYDGAAGRGQILYHADGHRTLQLDNHVAADLYSRVSGDRQMLEAHNIVYSTPADLLHLTRFAGEEGKDGIVLSKSGEDRVPRGTLEASGIPFRELPGHYELLASKTGEQPAYSLRNRAKGTDEQEAILKRAIAHSEYNMTPWDRMQHTMREFRDVVQSGDGVLELKQGYVDALAPIARYERHLNGGLLLDAAQSAYKMSWMAKNNEQITAGVMKLGVPRYNAGSFEVVPGRKGLMDIFKPLYHGVDGKPLDALWEGYAMARRSAELIKQTNPDGTSREKLLSQDDIDKLLDLEQKYPFFKTVLDDYQQFNNELLDLAVERGALSRETADLWKQNTYVPFYRALEEGNNETNSWRQGKGISGKKVTSQRLYGSDKMAEPIIESIIKNSGAILDKVYANEAMRRVVQVANGIGLERVKMPFSPVALSLGDIEKTLAKINYFAGTSKPSGGYTHHIPPAEMDRLVTFFKMSKPVGPDIVSVMEAGKPVYYKVTDASLYRAITAFNDIGSFDKVLGAILGVPKKVLTLGVTLDPRFMYRNFLRDAITTWAQTGTNPNMLKDMVKNAREVYSDGQFINQLRVAGYNGNEYFKVNEMRETLAEMHGAGWTVLNTPKKLYHAYHRIGFISEQTNRMRVAKHILDNGGSMAEAAWQAQNTLNFQMRGDNRAMQLLIRAVPFLNARIQGLNRLYDGATGRDVTGDRKRAVMSFLLKSASIMAASMALTLKNKDDPRFTRIPEASKDLYYHFFVGDHHFVLPKPFELGSLLGTLPERTFRFMTGRDTGKTFVQSMERMVTNTFQISVIPQAIQPGIEDWANKDSLTDNPIVSQSEQDLLPEAQYTPHTSPTIIDVAHAMPKLAPDALRSPARLEHLYRGYTATLGGYLLMMADGLQRATGSAPVAPASRYGHVALGALEGTFGLGNPATDPRNKYVQQVYDAQDEADRAAKTLSQYVKQGHVEDVRDLVKEERTALSYRATIRSVAAELGTMRKAEMAIYQSPTMSADDKRARLDKINAARQKMLDRIGPMLDMVTDYH